jgi:tetratricopeptide (TPR) repeat protein
MVDLAGALLFQGEPSQARPILEQALAISVRGYGFTHPRSLSIRNNLAVTIRQLGGINEAAQLHAEVLEARLKVSGAEDRDTLVAASNLAEALLVQGKLAEARSLQEKTLETSRRVLGENDLGTLLQENNLGVILSAQGDFSGARKLLEKALSSRKRILGPRHGDTSASAFNLLTVLQRSEDHEGAQKVLEEYLDWLLKGEDYPLDIYQRRIRRWLIDRSSSECSAASLNQLPSAPPVPNEKHENNQVDLSASDFHSPWPQVRDRPSVGDAARLGFGWNGHKQALKLLALIYRKPSAFLSELNRLSPARQVVAGLLLMVHGFPYLVFTSALGGHLATTFSKFVAQLCNLSAPTQPPLSRYVLMRILIALGLGVLSGTILGALRRSRTIGVVAFLVVTPSVVFAGCAFGPSPDAEINIPLMSLLCFTLGLDWTIAIGLGNVFESVRRGEVRRTVEVMVSYLFIAGLIYGITIKVGGGGRPPLSHRLEAGGIWAVLWTSAFLVGAFRLYYIPLHLVLLWPKARASWYGLHPVAWDDLCLMRFPYLDQFLMAFARKDPAGAEDEIQRLICAYPSQGIAALRAKLKILQSKEPSTLP